MKWSLADVADVPLGVVTVTSTVPVLRVAGEFAVIVLELRTTMLVALTPPNFTPFVVLTVQPPFPLNFVPVMVTVVPPLGEPPMGFTCVTVGAPLHAANAAGTSSAKGAANAPITTAASKPPSARRALVALAQSFF